MGKYSAELGISEDLEPTAVALGQTMIGEMRINANLQILDGEATGEPIDHEAIRKLSRTVSGRVIEANSL